MSKEDFEIVNKLGEGSYSTVFKVKRKSDEEIYALKQVKFRPLKSKERENALNEVRILASIQHPNIVGYKEAFADDENLYIITEFADDGDLLNRIQLHRKNRTFFEESEIWDLIVQSIRGLKALHDLKILHRDIKSANIFLCKDGTVKLGDMNVSKVAKRGMVYTQTGTPYYASPEVWKDLPYDHKSDLWSLGCVIYEACALEPPFKASDMKSLYRKVIRGEYPSIPKIYSFELGQMIGCLLRVNPHLRPSCGHVLEMPLITQRFNNNQDVYNNSLLQTIQMPPKIKSLSKCLPAPAYQRAKTYRASYDKDYPIDTEPKLLIKRTVKLPKGFPPITRKGTMPERVKEIRQETDRKHLPRIMKTMKSKR